MQRLIKDAAKLDKSVKANDMSFGNIVKAIHAVQVNMGVAGATSAEAEGTITGSLNSVKASWNNLMPALVQGGDVLDQCLDNFVETASAFGKNMLPTVEKALGGVGKLIEALVPIIEKELPSLVETLLPPLIKAAVSLTAGLIKALPTIVKAIAKEIPNAAKILWDAITETFGKQFPIVQKIGDFFKNNADSIVNAIKKITPVVIALAVAFKGFKVVQGISSLFGSKGGGTGAKGGIFSGLKDLAKMETTTVLKGMANLAIIFGGMTGLAAAFMLIAPFMAQMSDTKSILKMALVFIVLGAVGTALAKFGSIVGKIPVATVALGLANMAIMLAGMSALFLLVGAVSLIKGFDYKRILALVGIIGALGTVGAVLAVFGGICGIIPVAVVALGLANMAIMIAGMTALLVLINVVVSNMSFDVKKLLTVMGLITLLGAVGLTLSVFAGIAGAIPIPIVLAGLSNMALVLGGVTGLIIAFGKLTEIEGFTEFLTKGGETLAQVFGIIGDCAGSLIGSLGAAISESLPTIGENLGKFGENIKPLFDSIKGVDMGGVGAFFGSLVGLLGIATGNEIVEGIKSLFGGSDESALAKLGTDLCAFAENSQGFFNIVAGMNPTGFENAKLMLDSLAGLKSLPSEGGVFGWFTGAINYENLANGLGHLSNEKVIGFFNAVANIKKEAFDSAKNLFDCLAEMKSLPKDGGVAGWFTGTLNYEQIAQGLGHLSSEGVKKFFAMASGFDEKTFSNTSLLFETLAGMKALPKEGGFWQDLGDAITGEETKSKLSVIAEDLGNFAEKTGTFFANVNSLKLDNLNGLWKSLETAGKLTTTNLGAVIDESISTLVSKISALPQKMGDALRNNSKNFSDGAVDMWTDAVKASVTPANKLIDGANHILKEFGSNKSLISWKPYANGTNGHRGGNALVNDGRGAELVQMPNGYTFIPKGRNVFIPNAPNGMRVLSAEQTAQLMGKSSPTFSYANGTGNIDIWSYIDNAKGLVSKIGEGITYEGMSEFAASAGKGMVETFSGAMTTWLDKLFKESGQSLASYNASKGVMQWRSTVIRALKMEGQYSIGNVLRTLFQMQTESGGNPYAINLWDSNAKKGIPSKGLMQVIDPTFNAYARNGYNTNIYDPLSNILASIRYAISRYGSLSRAYRGVGYSNGGLVTRTGLIAEQDKPEWVIPTDSSKRKRALELYRKAGESLGLSSYTPESDSYYSSTNRVEQNTYAPHFELNITGTNDDRTMERKIKRWITEAWEDMLTGYESKSPQTQEV